MGKAKKQEEQAEWTEQDAPIATGLWVICFTGRDKKLYWWEKWGIGDKEFRHCYAVQYQPAVDRWVLLDWRSGLVDVVIFKPDEMKYILSQLRGNYGRAVLYKGQLPEDDIMFRIPIMYCVTAVLQVLGLPSRWTVTPKQLYQRLLKAGGEEIADFNTLGAT